MVATLLLQSASGLHLRKKGEADSDPSSEPKAQQPAQDFVAVQPSKHAVALAKAQGDLHTSLKELGASILQPAIQLVEKEMQNPETQQVLNIASRTVNVIRPEIVLDEKLRKRGVGKNVIKELNTEDMGVMFTEKYMSLREAKLDARLAVQTAETRPKESALLEDAKEDEDNIIDTDALTAATSTNLAKPFIIAAHKGFGHELAEWLAHDIAEVDDNAAFFSKGRFEGADPNTKMPIPSGCPQFSELTPMTEDVNAKIVGVYTDFSLETLKRLDLERVCRDYRMVHLVKDPVEAVVDRWADIVYDTDLKKTPLAFSKDPRKTRSVKKGLRLVAEASLEQSLPTMANLTAELWDREQVLTVGVEEFETDFNSAAEKVFSFLLGPKYPKMTQLKERSSRYDFSTWSKQNLRSRFDRYTDIQFNTKYPKKKVLEEVAEIAAEPATFPVMGRVYDLRSKMHYSP